MRLFFRIRGLVDLLICSVLLFSVSHLSFAADATQKPLLGMTIEELFENNAVRGLARAATEGSLEEIENLVKAGVEIDTPGAYGVTPLYWAIKPQNTARFEKLLQLGANPNALVGVDQSVIHWAAYISDPQFLQLCLHYGGDPNLLSENGFITPLMSASKSLESHMDNIELLVQHGANTEYRHTSNDITAIFHAANSYRYEHVYNLILAGADTQKTAGRENRKRNLKAIIARSGRGRFNTQEQTEYRDKVIEILKERGELPPDFE